MNKFIGYLVILWIVTLHVDISCASTPWENFNNLMGNYYLFDYQKVDQITCRITSSTLDRVKLREPLRPIENNIRIEENISDFRVTYSQKNGITFTEPRFEVFAVNSATADELKQLEASVMNFNQGVERVIKGLVQAIEGILDEFMLPKKDSISDLEISTNTLETIVKYKRRGASLIVVYTGNTRKTHSSMPGLYLDSEDEFDSVKGKLILTKSKMHMNQGDNKIDINLNIKHKDMSAIIFPSIIEQQLHIINPNMNMNAEFTITFDKCNIE